MSIFFDTLVPSLHFIIVSFFTVAVNGNRDVVMICPTNLSRKYCHFDLVLADFSVWVATYVNGGFYAVD